MGGGWKEGGVVPSVCVGVNKLFALVVSLDRDWDFRRTCKNDRKRRCGGGKEGSGKTVGEEGNR